MMSDSEFHQQYCHCVVKEYNKILMTGLPEREANLHDIPLDKVFIKLNIALESSRFERLDREEFAAERGQEQWREARRTEIVTLSLSEALQKHRCLIMRGAPGSGKTTLLRWLAVTFATQRQADGDRLGVQFEQVRFPVLIELRRFGVRLQKLAESPNAFDLAEEIAELNSVLVVVNTKAQAAALCRLLPPDTYYLSTNLCGQHRAELLAEIRWHLKEKLPIRVVSTQLIEAGVDVDFPAVYRALAGLDSIAQAAGRCNREGALADKGNVVVFVPPGNSKLKGHLGTSASVSRSLLPTFTQPPLHHSHYKTYFEHFYTRAKSRDEQGIVDLLAKNARELKIQFRTAALRFRLIKDDGFPILVTCGEGKELIKQLKVRGPNRKLMRKLQRYTVSVRDRDKTRLEKLGDIKELSNLVGVYELTTPGLYDPKYGLLLDPVQLNPADTIW